MVKNKLGFTKINSVQEKRHKRVDKTLWILILLFYNEVSARDLIAQKTYSNISLTKYKRENTSFTFSLTNSLTKQNT